MSSIPDREIENSLLSGSVIDGCTSPLIYGDRAYVFGASRMRLLVVALIAVLAIASPAIAQTRVAAIHPKPTLESVQSLPEVSVSINRPSGSEAAAEAARVKMEKFDLAIAVRDRRLLRSVCVGCRTTAKWAARRIEARGEGPEFPIADPAAAPDQ